MAVRKLSPLDVSAFNLGGAQFAIFICDTTGELPSGITPNQFRKGDLAVANDTNLLYVASSSTTWKLITGGGSSVSPATSVVNETGFGLAAAVGVLLSYAREDHAHGSVGHDSHALLGGVSADQHHAEIHGSAKHTGGIVALQEEGTGLGSAATLNFVGAGVAAALAGTVATVTIPGASTIPTQFVGKAANETVTSSTALQDDNDMFLTLAASEVWKFVVYSSWTGPGNIRLGWSVPAGCTMDWQAVTDVGTPALVTDVLSSAGGGSAGLWRLEGLIFNAATPGIARVRWAQATSNATATTLKKGSHIVALKVA